MFIAKASSTLYSKCCFYWDIHLNKNILNSNRVVKPRRGSLMLPYTALSGKKKNNWLRFSLFLFLVLLYFSICFTQWGHYIMEFPEHPENPIRLRAGLTGLRLMQRSNSSRWKCFFSRETFRASCDWKPRRSSRLVRHISQNILLFVGNFQNKISYAIMRTRI